MVKSLKFQMSKVINVFERGMHAIIIFSHLYYGEKFYDFMTPCFSTIFAKENNFYDFLFDFWQDPLKPRPTLKGKNLLREANCL